MDLRAAIDHTNLSPEAGLAQITKICEETLEHSFASACVHPYWIAPMAARFPSLRLCTVVNFPLGLSIAGAPEAERAVIAGARELDIVVNPAQVLARDWVAIEEELKSYRRIFPELTLKLIVESCQRTDSEIVRLTEICRDSGFDYIKTSTGFAKEGATVHAVALMAKHAGSSGLKVKASGGIRTLEQAEAMLAAGATRLGTSAGIRLLEEWRSRSSAQ